MSLHDRQADRPLLHERAGASTVLSNESRVDRLSVLRQVRYEHISRDRAVPVAELLPPTKVATNSSSGACDQRHSIDTPIDTTDSSCDLRRHIRLRGSRMARGVFRDPRPAPILALW